VIPRLFVRARQQRVAARLYDSLVEQARREEFYRDCGVPDSLDGRFDMIVLHAFLVLRRLNREGERVSAFSQALFDCMFTDMDVSLREIGVGDLSVGKKVKHMARSFYGRAVAYEAGLAGSDETLADALRRNLFGTVTPAPEHTARMADYLRREAAALDARPVEELLQGRLSFGPPPAAD